MVQVMVVEILLRFGMFGIGKGTSVLIGVGEEKEVVRVVEMGAEKEVEREAATVRGKAGEIVVVMRAEREMWEMNGELIS